MAPNRSEGGPSEYVRKAPETQRVNLSDLDPCVKVDVCRLLTALMNATIKQLNCQPNVPVSVDATDIEIADAIVGLAREYKANLSLADALYVAMVTSEDLLQLKAIMNAIDNSRRLDAILSKANQLLDRDDVTFSRNDQEIWLGRRLSRDTPYYLSARVMTYPYFDAAPPKGR